MSTRDLSDFLSWKKTFKNPLKDISHKLFIFESIWNKSCSFHNGVNLNY